MTSELIFIIKFEIETKEGQLMSNEIKLYIDNYSIQSFFISTQYIVYYLYFVVSLRHNQKDQEKILNSLFLLRIPWSLQHFYLLLHIPVAYFIYSSTQ